MPPAATTKAAAATPEARRVPAPAAASATSTAATVAANDTAATKALTQPAFAKRIADLSEPNDDFFSDNYVSNETSYLQSAALLADTTKKGGVYIGVGPEQNFTYIALTEPEIAYIVDIRRDNMVLHLLYKALFELADSRTEFLALLTARSFAKADDPGRDASIEKVIAAIDAAEKTDLGPLHERVLARVESYGVPLTAGDKRTLKEAHGAFAKDGLDLHFTLKENTFRKYPELRELIAAKDPQGKQLGFLANDELFERVQRMQRDNRIVPLVGNFAGDHALPKLAEQLKRDGQTVSAYYVSNVEQYLMADGLWWKWQRNIAALPTDDQSLFIRAYLDQGKAHPLQLAGHRTATTLHRIEDFNAREKPFASMHALASADIIAAAK